MNPDQIIIRFEQVAEQTEGPVRRLIGFVRAKHMLPLFAAADLEANPRSSKTGDVTDGIIDSIRVTRDIFPFKTKGILVGASHYESLQRNRYELQFVNPNAEGILDGGHNMLAIGIYILSHIIDDPREMKQIKTWHDLKEKWREYKSEIEALRKEVFAQDEEHPLDFLVPIEALVPSDLSDPEVVEAFNKSLLDICAARNNNVQLTDETKANKKGFYDELQKYLPVEIANRVEWKANEPGRTIKVRDLLALAWIPLSTLKLPDDEHGVPLTAPLPQNLYRNKGQCAEMFNTLMGHHEVSKQQDGEYVHKIHNPVIRSALKVAADIPALYDKIYRDFPYAYNDAEGRFGKLLIVKTAEKMRSKPTTLFTEQLVEYSYPDGLIMPLVYGLRALTVKGADGKVRWAEDPSKFLDDHFEAIVRKYRVILEAFRFDPQKIGKNPASYDFVVDQFETELVKRKASAA